MAETYLAACRKAYERDKNPIMAWRAFWWARLEGVRVPTWVLAYLEDVASDLLDMAVLAHTQPKNDRNADARIVRALKFKMNGPQTAMQRDRTATRNALIVRHMRSARRGRSDLKAFAIVGEQWNMSPENVRAIWKRAGK